MTFRELILTSITTQKTETNSQDDVTGNPPVSQEIRPTLILPLRGTKFLGNPSSWGENFQGISPPYRNFAVPFLFKIYLTRFLSEYNILNFWFIVIQTGKTSKWSLILQNVYIFCLHNISLHLKIQWGYSTYFKLCFHLFCLPLILCSISSETFL